METTYWTPVTNKFYDQFPCLSCNVPMTTQIESCSPQQIDNCSHIVCHTCIHTSYILNKSQLCPVFDCIKSVNPLELPSFSNADTDTDMYANVDVEQAQAQDNYELDYKCYKCNKTDCYNYCEGYIIGCCGVGTDKHYCGMDYCNGGCGVLWCGCIDVCRRRCGL